MAPIRSMQTILDIRKTLFDTLLFLIRYQQILIGYLLDLLKLTYP